MVDDKGGEILEPAMERWNRIVNNVRVKYTTYAEMVERGWYEKPARQAVDLMGFCFYCERLADNAMKRWTDWERTEEGWERWATYALNCYSVVYPDKI